MNKYQEKILHKIIWAAIGIGMLKTDLSTATASEDIMDCELGLRSTYRTLSYHLGVLGFKELSKTLKEELNYYIYFEKYGIKL